MKVIIAAILVTVITSCGKENSAGSGPRQNQETESEDLSTGSSSDLLNVTLDVPAEITSNQIIFQKAMSKSDKGEISDCSYQVTEGESYQYSVSGNELMVQTNGSRLQMKRVENSGTGIFGSWYSLSKGTKSRRETRISILPSRVVINVDCEFN